MNRRTLCPLIRRKSCLLAAMGLMSALAGQCWGAAPASPTTRPSVGVSVTDWVVLVADRNQAQVNDPSLYKSTLPGFAESRREAATGSSATSAMPIGLIRFAGQPGDTRQKLDVLIEAKGGRFLATWPPARSTVDRELWQNVQFTSDAQSGLALPEGHWLAPLREPGALWLSVGGKAEPFLAYDVQFPFPNPLRVEQAKQNSDYLVTNAGAASLKFLTIYKPAKAGWQTGTVDDLPGSGVPAAKPLPAGAAPSPPTAPVDAEEVLDEVAQPPAVAPTPTAASPAPAVATPTPSAEPTSQPSSRSKSLALNTDVRVAAEVFAPWRERLAAQGLSPLDTSLILQILAQYALDKERLTAVYQLDPAEQDVLLRLEIVPEPKKVSRVALVIVQNIDPAIEREIDSLIAQLGDDDWSKREAAYTRLQQIGNLARAKIEAAQQNKDLEVAWRAEKLVSKLNGIPVVVEEP